MQRVSTTEMVLGAAIALVALAAPCIAQVTAFIETEFDGEGGVDGLHGIDSVAASPDNAHVYTCGTRSDHAVAVFARNPETGELDFVEAEFDGVDGVDGLQTCLSVTVSPDGAHVYTAGREDDAVAIFARDQGTGELTFLEALFEGLDGVNGIAGAASIAVSSSGSHVYAAALGSNAVALFSRDPASGLLTFVEALVQGGMDGAGNVVTGLLHARAVAVSADDLHVYAVGEGPLDIGGGSLAVFSRDASSGRLTFVEALFDGGVDGPGNPIDGLGEATAVAISPDGGHVYTGSEFHSLGADDWMAVFSRDATTGELTFVEGHFSADFGCAGPNTFPADAAVNVSPDDNRVYATNPVRNALAVFSRDTATGELTLLETQCEGVGGVTGLRQPIAVTTNPNGLNVYTGATIGAALSAFDACAAFPKDNALPDMTVSDGVFQGCVSVSAGPFTVIAGAAEDAVVFRAGVRVELGEGFQVGDGGRFRAELIVPN